jgi:hypothetical protein
MANETTTVTLNDIVYSAVIEPSFLAYAMDWIVAQQFARRFSLVGMPSNALDIPRLATDMGTVGDGGTGVDTEFDATQASDLSANVALDTDKVTVTASEYAFKRTITDNVREDTIAGIDLLDAVLSDGAQILMTAFEDDMLALFASLSNTVGSTGVDVTLAQALAAQVGIRKRGVRAPDGVVYVLDEQQVDDLEALMIAAGANQATYTLAADKLLGIDREANNGMGNGLVFNFRGYPVYSTGLTDTANAGADVVGACFTPSSAGNDKYATYGWVDKRPFRVETERDASLRADEIVFSMRRGVAEITDVSGTAIITDA